METAAKDGLSLHLETTKRKTSLFDQWRRRLRVLMVRAAVNYCRCIVDIRKRPSEISRDARQAFWLLGDGGKETH